MFDCMAYATTNNQSINQSINQTHLSMERPSINQSIDRLNESVVKSSADCKGILWFDTVTWHWWNVFNVNDSIQCFSGIFWKFMNLVFSLANNGLTVWLCFCVETSGNLGNRYQLRGRHGALLFPVGRAAHRSERHVRSAETVCHSAGQRLDQRHRCRKQYGLKLHSLFHTKKSINQSINRSNRKLQVIQSTNQSIINYWFLLITLIKQSSNRSIDQT